MQLQSFEMLVGLDLEKNYQLRFAHAMRTLRTGKLFAVWKKSGKRTLLLMNMENITRKYSTRSIVTRRSPLLAFSLTLKSNQIARI